MKHESPFGDAFSLDREVAKGIMKIVILSCIKKSKTYPYAILKHMRKFGSPIAHMVNKSDMYNITATLEKEGFIKSKATLSGKRALKMYSITEKGASLVKNKDAILRRTFEDFRRLIKEEFNE